MFINRSKQNSESETKFAQERILQAERNVAELCVAFGAYSRKAARLRDVGDELTTTLQHYANAETVNQSLSNGLTNFAAALSTINNYGDKRVQYIDGKVVAQLAPYESICKNMKDGVKNIFVTKDKEVLRQRQLDRIKERNPRNRQQIVEAESELVHAKTEVSRSIHNLEDKITTFERQKLHDLKEIFLDFVCTEIGYHSKAISLLTEAYTSIEAINIDNDLEKFKTTLRNPNAKKQDKSINSIGKTSQSLGSLNTAGMKGIPQSTNQERSNARSGPRQRAMSEEVLNDHDSDVSESDYSDTETEDKPTYVKSRKQFV